MSRWRDIKQGKESQKKEELSSSSEVTTPCAPLSARLKAFLTDLFLIATPIFYIVIYLIMGSGEAFAQDRGDGWMMIIGVNALIIILFWFLKAQTPGLKAYSLKLVQKDFTKINLLQAIWRYMLTLVAIVSIILMFIPFFRKDKQTFQDLLSNTLIIEE